MPKYLIERELPGAGSLSREKLEEVARKSVCVLAAMDPSIQWVESYITPNALYCVYIAPNEEAIQEHGRRGSFPVTRVTRIVGRFDPTTADETLLAPR